MPMSSDGKHGGGSGSGKGGGQQDDSRAVTSWATVDREPGRTAYEVVQSGPRRLWDEVEAAWGRWDAHGRPGFERFGLTVSPDGQAVWLDTPDFPVQQWP
ncbi:hypothetical protein [Kitasatospora sp. NPDC059827]|uniref:hypothetical protein n=1 Tax=Kitasatospora sp. NPDC059827 TaxID=3346964 RepID=UPI0036532872